MSDFEKRQKLKIYLTKIDLFFEVVGWGVLVAMWLVVLLNYSNLPDTIPVHYNELGIIDGYGHKSSIWMLLVVASCLFIGMTILNKFPLICNYLTVIRQDNELRQYTIVTKMIRYAKFILVIIFGYLAFKTIRIALGIGNELGHFFMPLMIGLIFIPFIYYFYALIRKKIEKF